MTNSLRNYYDRSAELNLRNPWYREQVERYLLRALRCDAFSDITTRKIIGRNVRCYGVIRARQAGMVAGCEEVMWLLRNEGLNIKAITKDGVNVKRDRMIIKIAGNARTVLSCERTALNILQRMSGIATITARCRELIGQRPLIAATRKTLLGALDKRAVAWGGGYTHRLGLYDGVLVKENHLALVDHDQLKAAHWHKKPFALEIASMAELKRAVVHYPQFTILLLDNFSVERLRVAMRWLKQQNFRKRYIIEASGGINLENIQNYARTGVDVLSLGFLTHSAPALDCSLDIIPFT